MRFCSSCFGVIQRKIHLELLILANAVSTNDCLTLLHSKRPKLHTILAFLSAIGLKVRSAEKCILNSHTVAVFRNNCVYFAVVFASRIHLSSEYSVNTITFNISEIIFHDIHDKMFVIVISGCFAEKK